MKSASLLARSGKRHASNICLVTFIIEIGFADPFDSQIFSMNAETERGENDYAEGSDHGGSKGTARRKRKERGGEIEGARCSLAASAECSYFVLITKTLSGKGGERSRKKRNWHKEKTYRRVTNVLP